MSNSSKHSRLEPNMEETMCQKITATLAFVGVCALVVWVLPNLHNWGIL